MTIITDSLGENASRVVGAVSAQAAREKVTRKS